jgi:hypothetical protein
MTAAVLAATLSVPHAHAARRSRRAPLCAVRTVWTGGVSEDEYAAFLRRLFHALTTPTEHECARDHGGKVWRRMHAIRYDPSYHHRHDHHHRHRHSKHRHNTPLTNTNPAFGGGPSRQDPPRSSSKHELPPTGKYKPPVGTSRVHSFRAGGSASPTSPRSANSISANSITDTASGDWCEPCSGASAKCSVRACSVCVQRVRVAPVRSIQCRHGCVAVST